MGTSTNQTKPTTANPLLETSRLPFGAVPFDRIEVSHFVPALEEAVATARERIKAITTSAEIPTFKNTIVALERAASEAYDVAYVYGNLRAAHGDAAMHALAKEMMPRLVQLESDVYLDEALYARVRKAYESLDRAKLSKEDLTLADKTWRAFKRGGAELPPEAKAKLRAIDEELSTLGPQFAENVLKATNAYELVIRDKRGLAGLPDSAVEAAAQAAKEKGKDGAWVFTLQGPSFLAFMKYAEDRELRRQMWVAYMSRAVGGTFGNEALVKRIASLRRQRAKLLGYESHAHYQMEERMAEHPDRVKAFLDRLLERSQTAGRKEMDDLQAYAVKKGETFAKGGEGGPKGALMPWDYAYWSNRMKEELYAVKGEELRPYFRLESVLEGAFEHARRLYDLDFKPLAGADKRVPLYAPDVLAYEVTDATTGAHRGLFYADFHPRATKGGGAWCTRFKGQWLEEDGADKRPHVSIVCNFTAPTPGKPSLLTYMEVQTLFHEFGHALHSLLSQVRYRSLSCTNVYRDFVELPSQVMENWLREKESLGLFARHWETGQPIPSELVDRVIAGDKFHAAYQMLRQLRYALLDLAWYGGADPDKVQDVTEFERSQTAATAVLPDVAGTNMSCSFEHIFAGGYSAGYYGYKWAEVLDADAFELFKERGIFARDVADRFRKAILERGGSEHPMTLYREFRGREPDPDALLRRAGLL
jgi:peptidyl-dipeptidase Dcp